MLCILFRAGRPIREVRDRYTDCYDLQTVGGIKKNGVHTVYVRQRRSGVYVEVAVRVYCDMITEGGGWTVCIRT